MFLLEPCTDPAIQQQAVARVHRIGQTRNIVVHRLIVKNTVEEHVLREQESRQPLFRQDLGADGAPAAIGGITGAASEEVLQPEDVRHLLTLAVKQVPDAIPAAL